MEKGTDPHLLRRRKRQDFSGHRTGRARGRMRNNRSYYARFLKNEESGELEILDRIPEIHVIHLERSYGFLPYAHGRGAGGSPADVRSVVAGYRSEGRDGCL